MPGLMTCLTLLASLGCGVAGGVFFAFSTFIMRALAKLPATQGMAAMQAINVTVINVLFMGTLFGTAALCVGLAITAGLQWQRPGSGSGWMLAASLCYLIGTIGVTIAFHVPRNDALALLDPNAVESARAWATYVSQWTAGNHVRTAAAIAAAAMFLIAAWQRQAGVAAAG